MIFNETIAGEPHYLLMVMPPNADAAAAEVMPREMIFIVDTSGRCTAYRFQAGEAALLPRPLDGLRPNDRFNVIEFNSQTRALFAQSVPAERVNVARAPAPSCRDCGQRRYRNAPALERALRTPAEETHLRQIVFITDGSVGNEEELYRLIEQRLGSARLFTVGIGSAPNSWFMRKSAELGRGTFVIISALHEVREKMDTLFRKLEHPQVTNIDLEWPGGNVVDSYPAIVPDLYRGEPVTVKTKAATVFRSGDVVRVSGDSAAGAWSRDLELSTRVMIPVLARSGRARGLPHCRTRSAGARMPTRFARRSCRRPFRTTWSASIQASSPSTRRRYGRPVSLSARNRSRTSCHLRPEHERDLRFPGDGNELRELRCEAWR